MSNKFYIGNGKTAKWPDLPPNLGATVMGLHYRNTLLLQQVSKISSRSEVNISSKIGPFELGVPLITAAMDTICGEEMARALFKLGALGVLPRAHTQEEFAENLEICKRLNQEQISCIYSIGLSNSLEEATSYIDMGAQVLLIDVAQGGMEKIIEQALKIRKKFPKVWLFAGSVSNQLVAKMYMDAGIDIVKLGVGNGSACDTRQQAGTGTPQLSAILDCTNIAGLTVVADGGIHNSGDVAKALAAGANVVMSGSIFAGTKETPGKLINGYKTYRGQASSEFMKSHKIEKGHRSIEGVSMEIPYKGSVSKVIEEYSAGLRSAFSYSGAKNLSEFQKKSVFQYVGETTYALESLPQIPIEKTSKN